MEESQPKISSKKSKWPVILIIILIIVGASYFIWDNTRIDYNPVIDVNATDFKENVCSQIRVTPTWISKDGIIDEGYNDFNVINDPKTAVDLLINTQVFFIYHSDCGACEKQIGYFGKEWGRYVESGYTINCKNV